MLGCIRVYFGRQRNRIFNRLYLRKTTVSWISHVLDFKVEHVKWTKSAVWQRCAVAWPYSESHERKTQRTVEPRPPSTDLYTNKRGPGVLLGNASFTSFKTFVNLATGTVRCPFVFPYYNISQLCRRVILDFVNKDCCCFKNNMVVHVWL